MIIEKYELIFKCFSWDNDGYEEFGKSISFDTFEEALDFNNQFFVLPQPNWDMPYFGKFKEMKDFKNLISQYGKDISYDGGGVSIYFKCLFKKIESKEIYFTFEDKNGI